MSQFIVGLTGGIGSGKTAVSDSFAELGIDIVDADLVSRIVVEPSRPALATIAQHFGQSILTEDGHLDRAQLRAIIFKDPEAKRWLESLLHPLIAEEIQRQLESVSSPYGIFVSPLLIEAGQRLFCDRVLVVDVPESVQLERTMARDSNDREQVERIIASQINRQDRRAAADDILDNSRDLATLKDRVAALHEQYLGLAKVKVS